MTTEDQGGADDSAAAAADGTPTQEDAIKNVKAEMNRKLENLTGQLQQQSQQIEQKFNAILSTLQKPSTEGQEDLADMMLTDPKKAAEIIKRQAVQEVRGEMASRDEMNNTIATLASEFPEIKDNNSDLAKKAIELYNSPTFRLKNTPEGYEMAIRKAANILGAVPVDKRRRSSDDSEDFSMGSGTGGSGQRQKSKQKSAELSPETLAFAEAVGLNIKDSKVLESLQKRAERKDWNRYK